MKTTFRLNQLEGSQLVAWGFSSYPLLLAYTIYGTWLVAWLIIGHRPCPHYDDPKYINNWAFTCLYARTLMMILVCYMALLANAGFVLIEVVRRLRRRQWNVALLILVPSLLWTGLYLLSEYDPGMVGDWLWD